MRRAKTKSQYGNKISNARNIGQYETEETQEKNSEIRGFWRLATKWHFLPFYYVFFAIIYGVIRLNKDVISLHPISDNPLGYFIFALWFMPFGLFNYPILNNIANALVPFLYFLIIVPFFQCGLLISSLIIHYYKSRENKVLKVLIITWLVLILTSFIGSLTLDF